MKCFTYTLIAGLIFLYSMLFLNSCKEEITIPVLTTLEISDITQTTALSGGNISYDGGAPITSRGVCWSTSANPTITDFKTTDDSGTGIYISHLTQLNTNTTYYVRAYAVNDVGTVYGNEIIFTLWINQQGPKINDIEGNSYNSVKIGSQIWMAENLKTKKYNDGKEIPLVTGQFEWANLITPGYCWLKNDETTFKDTYGALYNWEAVNTGKLCPSGWHVPSLTELTTLLTFLGGNEDGAGGKMKEAGTEHWLSPNTGGSNLSGFTALPGADRDMIGIFNSLGTLGFQIGVYGMWWSSTLSESYSAEACYFFLNYNTTNLRTRYILKEHGFSIRCLMDQP